MGVSTPFYIITYKIATYFWAKINSGLFTTVEEYCKAKKKSRQLYYDVITMVLKLRVSTRFGAGISKN